MGQKTHPYGLRLGIVTDWTARWYAEKDYAANVYEDYKIRTFLNTELKRGAISRIDIERIGDKKVQVDIHTGRPGVVIGRGGSEAERMRAGLEKLSGRRVKFNVVEVHNPEVDATLLARSVADQLEGRVSFRRAMKRTVATALKAGAEGVRVQASGRLGGSDMGRREWYLEGRVPLHTLRADIDYGEATASTTVGAIGVKVWVYKGDIMKRVGSGGKAAAEARLATGGPADRDRRRSVKSRAEQAAGGGADKRIIEAGGGKRVVESGDSKRSSGRRLIEAGGGKRVTAADASAEFEEAKQSAVAEEAVAEDNGPQTTDDRPEPETGAEAVAADAVAEEAVVEAVVAEAVAEEAIVEAVVAEEAAEVADEDDTGEEK
jgi:small subunit ribosomal protein S3